VYRLCIASFDLKLSNKAICDVGNELKRSIATDRRKKSLRTIGLASKFLETDQGLQALDQSLERHGSPRARSSATSCRVAAQKPPGQRSSSERPRLLEAFSPLDPHLAKQLDARLLPAGIPESKDGWRDELRRNKRDAKSLWENAIRLEKKFAQLEKSGEDYVFDSWNIDDSPYRKENVSLGTGN
jgi:hypothetical protein